MGILRYIALAIAALSALLSACKEEKKVEVDKLAAGTDSFPTMTTRDVTTLISDSGMTRYRVTAKLWLVYDEARVPVWRFPEGLFLEKFDNDFKVDATVKCDSAIYYKLRKLWQLDGNVRIRNAKNEMILTDQLFWDQARHEMRSDSFVHIERSDRVIEGYGFRSDEKLENYVVRKPQGIFPVPERRDSAAGG